mmetsp:Transcript_39399/g.102063  ORF Transcript_39399/g.102063 Transcript_39399/m.102063 type:complete len:223 (+) Transcript_39399:176-844(+)
MPAGAFLSPCHVAPLASTHSRAGRETQGNPAPRAARVLPAHAAYGVACIRGRWAPPPIAGKQCAAVRSVLTPAAAADTLTGEDLAAWESSAQLLEDLGFDSESAVLILERSFGWGKPSQGFWRGQVVEVVPTTEQMEEVINYLGELGIKGNDLIGYINKFPNVFGCSVEDLLKANVTELEKTWKIKGPTLSATLKRRPEILGYNVDCLGNCLGECNRCWVRF